MLGKLSKLQDGREDPFPIQLDHWLILWCLFASPPCILVIITFQRYFASIFHCFTGRHVNEQWHRHMTPTSFDMFGSFLICMGHFVVSTALHRHDQLAKYHPVPWLRWPNVFWHRVFCCWGYSRWVPGFTIGSWIHGFLDSRWVLKESLRTLRSP